MKGFVALLLTALFLLPLVTLPVTATAPHDPLVATVTEKVTEALGQDTPGAAVAVYRAGQPVLLEGFGYADLGNKQGEERRLMTVDTTFEIGRLSGLFVALAACRMAAEGLLHLDADIATYLPAEQMEALALTYPVNMRQLLSGTAGFEGRTFDLVFSNPGYCFDNLTDALMAEIPRQIYAPGQFCSYSEFGVALAALVVQTLAGEPYHEYVSRLLLEPLEMNDTLLFATEDSVIARPAVGYTALGEGNFSTAPEKGRSYFGLYPANGALSTVADLSKLLALLQGEYPAILPAEAMQHMLAKTDCNGIFSVSSAVFSLRGDAYGVEGATPYFSASLYFNGETAALVLVNAPESALLALPRELCGGTVGRGVSSADGLHDLKTLRGTYLAVNTESRSLVGRLFGRANGERATVGDDGLLYFLDKSWRQIAPGMFAEADATPDESGEVVVTLQFMVDENKEVCAVLLADGRIYRPAAFYECGFVPNAMLALFFLFTVCLLLSPFISILRLRRSRGKYDCDEGVRHVVPDVAAALSALLALIAVWVGMALGSAAIPSFYGAISVPLSVLSFAALGAHLIALFTSVGSKRIFRRQLRVTLFFVLYLLILSFWRLLLLF